MIKSGMAPAWRVRFKKQDGWMTFVEYGDTRGPLISKLRVIKEAKAELARNPDFAEIDEVYPVSD